MSLLDPYIDKDCGGPLNVLILDFDRLIKEVAVGIRCHLRVVKTHDAHCQLINLDINFRIIFSNVMTVIFIKTFSCSFFLLFPFIFIHVCSIVIHSCRFDKFT